MAALSGGLAGSVGSDADSGCQGKLEETVVKRRKLCSLGTGEVILVLHYKAKQDQVDAFEERVQDLARSFYDLQSGITDVRVCHPCCGEVCFIATFLTSRDRDRFDAGPRRDAEAALADCIEGGAVNFRTTGTQMPAAHSMASLLDFLRENVKGDGHQSHDVKKVKDELAKWFPRTSEWNQYVKWDAANPTKYTRNLIFQNEHMDVILMCWPPGSVSTIHDHDNSSCWVAMVDGEVHEVQYAVPQLDLKFIESEMRDPTGAVGRCGELKAISVAKLEPGGCTTTYANNDIGLHRIENRSATEPAYTLHVYAPGLKRMKIFKETGEVFVHVTAASQKDDGSDGVPQPYFALDVDVWNTRQAGKTTVATAA